METEMLKNGIYADSVNENGCWWMETLTVWTHMQD